MEGIEYASIIDHYWQNLLGIPVSIIAFVHEDRASINEKRHSRTDYFVFTVMTLYKKAPKGQK